MLVRPARYHAGGIQFVGRSGWVTWHENVHRRARRTAHGALDHRWTEQIALIGDSRRRAAS